MSVTSIRGAEEATVSPSIVAVPVTSMPVAVVASVLTPLYRAVTAPPSAIIRLFCVLLPSRMLEEPCMYRLPVPVSCM